MVYIITISFSHQVEYILLIFVCRIVALLHVLSGALFAIWGPLAHPQMFGLGRAVDVIIWVLVGGKATLIGPIAGAIGIEYLKVWLGTQGVGQVPFVLGLVLMLFVLLFQQGVLPSLGMVLAFRLSHRLGLCAEADGERVSSHLAALGLATGAAQLPPAARRTEALIRHMSHDKKMQDGRLRMILARGIGAAFIAEDVGEADIGGVLDAFMAARDSI